jgi:hypothetical protein
MIIYPCDPFIQRSEAVDFRQSPSSDRSLTFKYNYKTLPDPIKPDRTFFQGEQIYRAWLVKNDTQITQSYHFKVNLPGNLFVIMPWLTTNNGVKPDHQWFFQECLLLNNNGPINPNMLLKSNLLTNKTVTLTLQPQEDCRLLFKAQSLKQKKNPTLKLFDSTRPQISYYQEKLIPIHSNFSVTDTIRGLYLGLIPYSTSRFYGLDSAPWRSVQQLLSEWQINSLVIGSSTISPTLQQDLTHLNLKQLVLGPEAFKQTLLTPLKPITYCYTADEPHHSPQALELHHQRATLIHQAKQKTFTAVGQETYSDLDVPLFSLGYRDHNRLKGELFYFQGGLNRPAVNYFLAGDFCYTKQAKGVIPYGFLDGYDHTQPEKLFTSDISSNYKNGLRIHQMIIPTQTGLIRTLGGEAYAAGLQRYMRLSKQGDRFKQYSINESNGSKLYNQPESECGLRLIK